MAINFLTLAEGAVNDGRGALVLTGVNQRVIAPISPSFNIKQKLVVTLSDEIPGSPGQGFGPTPDGTISVRVLDPTGSAIFTKSEDIKLSGEKQWLDLPLVVNIVMDVDIKGESYGVYVVEVTYRSPDSEEPIHCLPLYIVEPKTIFGSGETPSRAFSIQ